jgi:transposase
MEDRELSGQILGIQRPWGVERVELKLEEGAVHVHWRHEEDALWECAECGQLCRLHDHQQERQWRRLDTCQFQTILHARPPRTRCDEHGALVARSLWAEAGEVLAREEAARQLESEPQTLQRFRYEGLKERFGIPRLPISKRSNPGSTARALGQEIL